MLKFGMWGANGGENLQCKNDFNSRREHRSTYV